MKTMGILCCQLKEKQQTSCSQEKLIISICPKHGNNHSTVSNDKLQNNQQLVKWQLSSIQAKTKHTNNSDKHRFWITILKEYSYGKILESTQKVSFSYDKMWTY